MYAIEERKNILLYYGTGYNPLRPIVMMFKGFTAYLAMSYTWHTAVALV